MANEVVYNIAKYRLATGQTDWDGANIKCLLLGGASVPASTYNPDWNTVNDLLTAGPTGAGATELSAAGYTRKSVTGSAAEDDANNRAALDASSVTWTSIGTGTEVARALVFYDEGGGTDSTRYLISFHDGGFPVTLNGGDLTVNTPNDVIWIT